MDLQPITSQEVHTYERTSGISIAARDADIVIPELPYRVLIKKDSMYVDAENPADARLYLNDELMEQQWIEPETGDVITVEDLRITIFEEFIEVEGDTQGYSCRLLQTGGHRKYFEGFPKYKRSPRLIMPISKETYEISNPPEEAKMSKSSLAQIIISPVVMLIITVAISILMKRGLYVVLAVTASVMSMIFSVTKYITEKKECRINNEKRQKLYENYLLDMRKRLYRAWEREQAAYDYNYPTVTRIGEMIGSFDRRIYERCNYDDDFLTVSLGTYKSETTFHIKSDYNELTLKEDALKQEAQEIKNQFSLISRKAQVIDLKRAHLGIVGTKENIHEQLKVIVAQLTFMQSYHDIEIITVYDEKYKDDFHWMRWYPHCRIKAINVYGSIYSEYMRDQILGSMHQIIKDRQLRLEENKKDSRFLPYYVFIIDEPRIIMDHSVMEYLGKAGSELGFSIIYTSYLQANLPENIGTVLELKSADEGVLILNEKDVLNRRITLDRIGDADMEQMARNLSILVHEQGIVTQIPDSITFFDMYHVDNPKKLEIEDRWRKNESHRSLAVPLGVRAVDDLVCLNLHEKAHGPHGLVAGTTGSGKSEIIQSYILSLAVNFHPYEVGFLLIDYKGGGMANLFSHLPHLLGTITNLDGSESMRALASIKSELARRQRVFSEYGVNHINAYNKLYKMGTAKEPIPHLFLISDEFAELKKEQPDFMRELVSAARIGRSLGIHLILATQKPSGVVDDQIWTNSKFKLALKVQTEQDSKEILKTPDAANITQAGRAYLQVGNNEIYELFQSAWSGAAYTEGHAQESDDRVYLLNALGQGELINGDLSGGTDNDSLKKTQLDVTVEYIEQLFEKSGCKRVKKPWLEPLPKRLVSPYVTAAKSKDVLECQTLDMTARVGMMDIPEQQLQEEYTVSLAEDGNIAIFGASGFGKSVMLTTILLSFAVKNSPQNLIYYIMDLGNAALISLKDLPHTADYMTVEDGEKVRKFVHILEAESAKRKKLFAKVSAMNFETYNHMCDEKLPAILWVIDNYDAIKDWNPDLENVVKQVFRDGYGLGIYVLMTASRPSAVRFAVLNNFKTKIAYYMFDKGDINTAVGKSDYALTEISGRALVRPGSPVQMQTYMAVDADNDVAYITGIRDVAESISTSYSGRRAPAIPMLPETVTSEDIIDRIQEAPSENRIPVGLDTENVQVQYLELDRNKQIIIGGTQSGKTNLLKTIIDNRVKPFRTYIVDTKEAELYTYRQEENVVYVNQTESIELLLDGLKDITESRRDGYETALDEHPDMIPKEYYDTLDKVMVLIDDWDNFITMVTDSHYAQADQIIMNAALMNVTYITTTMPNRMKGFDPLSKWMRESVYGVVYGNPADQSIFSIPLSKKGVMTAGIGYLFDRGKTVRVKFEKI